MIARYTPSSLLSQQTAKISPLLPTLMFVRSCVNLGNHKQEEWIKEVHWLEIASFFLLSLPFFSFFCDHFRSRFTDNILGTSRIVHSSWVPWMVESGMIYFVQWSSYDVLHTVTTIDTTGDERGILLIGTNQRERKYWAVNVRGQSG